jgi:hypothetical protein
LVFLDISLLWIIFWFAKEARLPAAILSFISSSIMLSLVTVVPRYLDGSFYNKICRPYINVRSYTQNIGHKKELNGCPQIRATVEHTGRTRWHDLRRPSCAERQSNDGSSTFHRLSSLVAGQLQALSNTTHISHNNSSTVTCTKQRWHLQISYRILSPKADTPVRTLPIIGNDRTVNQPKSYLGLFSPSCVIPHPLAQWQTPTVTGPALTLTSFPSRLKTSEWTNWRPLLRRL